MTENANTKAPLPTRILGRVGRAVESLTGRGPAGSEVKRARVRDIARQFALSTLVETGTFQGDMIEATRDMFRQIISVEVVPELHEKARQRFAAHPHIQLLLGDSGELMPAIVQRLQGPALFWLDGHYSGGETGRGAKDTPIMLELSPILSDKRFQHVLLIDDARYFKGKNDYPTLGAVRSEVQRLRPRSVVFVRNDAIHVYPPDS